MLSPIHAGSSATTPDPPASGTPRPMPAQTSRPGCCSVSDPSTRFTPTAPWRSRRKNLPWRQAEFVSCLGLLGCGQKLLYWDFMAGLGDVDQAGPRELVGNMTTTMNRHKGRKLAFVFQKRNG